MEVAMSTVKKVTFNLPEDLLNRMKKEAEKQSITVTEAIRRYLETAIFITKEEEAGSTIFLEKKDKKLVQLVRR
jgi:hypothetical protein